MRHCTLPSLVATVALVAPQDPQGSAQADWHVLALRTTKDNADARVANAELRVAVERDYPGAFAAHAAMTDGAARRSLGFALRLDEIAAADLIVRGTVVRCEQKIGRIYSVLAQFASLEVLRGSDDLRASATESGGIVVLRGNAADRWLGDLMVRDLELEKRERVFVLRKRVLEYGVSGTATRAGVMIFEYETLPPAAAKCVR